MARILAARMNRLNTDHLDLMDKKSGLITSSTFGITLDGRKLSSKLSKKGVYINGGHRVVIK